MPRILSIIVGCFFVLLCMAFPIYLDYIKRPSIKDLEKSSIEKAPAISDEESDLRKSKDVLQTAPSQLISAFSLQLKNIACRAYVIGRCSAFGMGREECSLIEEEALEAPLEEGLDSCRKRFKEKIENLYKSMQELKKMEEPSERKKEILPTAPVQLEERKIEKKEEVAKEKTKPEIKEETLYEIYKLILEIQSSSYNYSTLPLAQNERLNRLKELTEGTNDEKLINIYHNVLKQVEGSPLNLMPSGMIKTSVTGTSTAEEVKSLDLQKHSLQPGEKIDDAQTPELKMIKEIIKRTPPLPKTKPSPSPEKSEKNIEPLKESP